MATDEGVEECELCIVGGGYAALNALNAAAGYLREGDRVVVIDRNERWGGQWLHQYDFLRLHQPYQLFTAGDQPWRLGAPREHLASTREVLEHLASVPGVSAGHLRVEPLFRREYVDHAVRDGRVELDARSLDGRAPVRVRARRLLKAGGLDIEMLPAFPVSSERVRSVGVADPVLGTPEFLDGDAPIYVIGCGKSAMDLVGHLVRTGRARRRVRLISGSGMWFFSRDHGYTTGLRRYYAGALATDLFLEIVQRFDGENELEVARSLGRQGAMISVLGEGNCRYGLLSIAEKEAVLSGLTETHPGHLVDVEGTRMTIRDRDGRLKDLEVEPGAWLVNCTSHFKYRPPEPVLADGGLVCTPQYGLGFTGTTAYFLTHLWYRDALGAIADRLRTGRVDVEPKLRFLCHIGVMVLHNMSLVAEHLPLSVGARFRGDFNKWYPLHRQIPALLRMGAYKKEAIAKGERFLPTRFSDPAGARSAPTKPPRADGKAPPSRPREGSGEGKRDLARGDESDDSDPAPLVRSRALGEPRISDVELRLPRGASPAARHARVAGGAALPRRRAGLHQQGPHVGRGARAARRRAHEPLRGSARGADRSAAAPA